MELHYFDNLIVLSTLNSAKFSNHLFENFHNIHKDKSIFLGIMGPNIKEINIKNNFSSLITIESPSFNYSLLINCLLKSVEKIQNDNTMVLITDCDTSLSLKQIEFEIFYKYNPSDSDFNDCFITINGINNFKDFDFQINEKLMLSITKRVQKCQRCNERITIPSIICKPKYLTMINGLEEDIFSYYSRLQVIQQLKNLNLTEIQTEGMCLTQYPPNSNIELKDIEYIKKFSKISKNIIIGMNNYQKSWGTLSKLNYIKILNGIPYWNIENDPNYFIKKGTDVMIKKEFYNELEEYLDE